MIRTGLLGHPVAHSRSPALHRAWFAETGIPGRYELHDLPPDTPGDVLLRIADERGLTGVNLTVPLKTRVMPHLAACSPRARRLGAVNTLVRDETGWRGRNTDVDGFSAELRALHVQPGPAVVLGAGGAARAVVLALQEAGWPAITVLNRSPGRTRSLIAALRGERPLEGGPLSCFADVAPSARLVVNTTSGPARAAVASLDAGILAPSCAWIDLNYWMIDPPWIATLRDRGHEVGTGHRMLVHQGVAAFEAFTGVRPDPAVGLAILGLAPGASVGP
jgi:shikimate dehydrogenase